MAPYLELTIFEIAAEFWGKAVAVSIDPSTPATGACARSDKGEETRAGSPCDHGQAARATRGPCYGTGAGMRVARGGAFLGSERGEWGGEGV